MQAIKTAIPEVIIIEPKVFSDSRGFFYESFNQKAFNAAIGQDICFVQDNHSKSAQKVLRGLHYQLPPHAQGKLVSVVQGAVIDVSVDIRRGSKTFGQHVAIELSAENKRQLWIPAGFAHGFMVLSETAEFLYKTTDYYAPEFERNIRWDDPALGIDWRLNGATPLLSAKDQQAVPLSEAELN